MRQLVFVFGVVDVAVVEGRGKDGIQKLVR
jgi:hypothetical protein